MKKTFFTRDIFVIIILFIISRIILGLFGIDMDYSAIYWNWQYLDMYTLKHNLLQGVWYDHSQPPVFNLFLGAVLKITSSAAPITFSIIFKLITLFNALLLYSLLKRTVEHKYIPLIISLIYLLNPASLLFENDLLYTSFISLFLLICCHFLLNFREKQTWKNSAGLFLSLVIICLSRSMYHLVFLIFLAALVLIYYKKRAGFRILLTSSILAFLFVGGWYVKNYILFKNFSMSSWDGMNIAMNVFHDEKVTDSTKIESVEPFSKISAYKAFITPGAEDKYKGLNDRDLLFEMKNDTWTNYKHVAYLEVSRKYMEACKEHVMAHPMQYVRNILWSSIIFFEPATIYPTTDSLAQIIKYYDLIYSFNLTHLIGPKDKQQKSNEEQSRYKQQRRITVAISAIPKLLMYILVFFAFFKRVFREKRILLLHLFITGVIAYVFFMSSFFEHYENMRYRYEAEPLFLVIAGYVLVDFLNKRKLKKTKADTA